MNRRWRVLIAIGLGLAALPAGAMALGGLFVPAAEPAAPAQALGHDLADEHWRQVQIEQHLIIRITPGNPTMMRDMPPPALQPLPERLHARRMAPCLPVAGIAGVRPLANNRLLLFMRDHRLVGADLSRNCTARDFYLGFYVSPTADGQLCAGRDTIHSRAGTTCTISEVHELVPTN
jgi:hypothetical protein